MTASRDAQQDASVQDCQNLAARWDSLIAGVSRACQQDGDCLLAGGLIGVQGGVSGRAGIGFTGRPVNTAAYSQSEAPPLEADWAQMSCGELSDPVCANNVACTAGQCVAVSITNCCAWGPCDSGMPTDAGGPSYASVNALVSACGGGTSCASVTITSAVVTAVRPDGLVLWVQDMGGGPKSGVAIFCNPNASVSPCSVSTATIKALTPGNLVQLAGVWAPYHATNEIRPTAITVLDGTATTLPAATDITAAQADMSQTASDYAGVLVNVISVPLHVVGNTGAIGTPFDVSDGTSTIHVEATFQPSMGSVFGVPCAGTLDGGAANLPVVQAGDTFLKLGGILDFDTFAGTLVLQPSDKSQCTYDATGDHDGG